MTTSTRAPADRISYRNLLTQIHWHLLPRTYVEIGVYEGASLRTACPCTRVLGVDPDPRLAEPPPPNVTVLRQTSDELFARPDLDDLLGGQPIDLAFVDGMHLFEYALRDVMNIERRSHAGGTILVHDCHPIDAATSTRERQTVIWTGDVWKLIVILREYRPDLDVQTLDAAPTGLGVIRQLDPTSRVLDEHYDEIVDRYLDLGYDDLVTPGERGSADGAVAGAAARDSVEHRLDVRPVHASTLSELWPDAPLQPFTPALRVHHLVVDGPVRARDWIKHSPVGPLVRPFVSKPESLFD